MDVAGIRNIKMYTPFVYHSRPSTSSITCDNDKNEEIQWPNVQLIEHSRISSTLFIITRVHAGNGYGLQSKINSGKTNFVLKNEFLLSNHPTLNSTAKIRTQIVTRAGRTGGGKYSEKGKAFAVRPSVRRRTPVATRVI